MPEAKWQAAAAVLQKDATEGDAASLRKASEEAVALQKAEQGAATLQKAAAEQEATSLRNAEDEAAAAALHTALQKQQQHYRRQRRKQQRYRRQGSDQWH